ncbi:sulfite exporter TauE/SafE family protein [Psychromarinibacter sp. C21-152]|uniref:Probable membrane transporter protein n=1 Tax=Psychromarinibacter sediminicola TaxID=3033385 RepID=A0AAE3NRL3_9RHOB|nr:sulfite exporter TauE/SafE family protein [Psychromarinibacter sediminicola]MDF0603003.1 sulfite exporter TauE/SafE family protein [Psychromarinibacter sediminicola]
MTADPIILSQLIVLTLLVGAFAGVLAGLLGVGGGIVLVPAFYYGFSILGYGSDALMQICIATSLATIVVTSARSLHAHNRRGAVEWAILKTWAPGILIGAAVAVLVAAALRSETLQAIFAAFALLIGLYMTFGRSRWQIAPEMPGGIVRAVASPVIGFLSVLMGIGGGSFGVPFMTLHGVAIHRAVATAAGFGLLIALPAVVGFAFVPVEVHPPYSLGAINIPTFFIIVSMTLLTAPLGARLAHALQPGRLKRVFGAFLILVALNMMRQALGY